MEIQWMSRREYFLKYGGADFMMQVMGAVQPLRESCFLKTTDIDLSEWTAELDKPRRFMLYPDKDEPKELKPFWNLDLAEPWQADPQVVKGQEALNELITNYEPLSPPNDAYHFGAETPEHKNKLGGSMEGVYGYLGDGTPIMVVDEAEAPPLHNGVYNPDLWSFNVKDYREYHPDGAEVSTEELEYQLKHRSDSLTPLTDEDRELMAMPYPDPMDYKQRYIEVD